jgi:hypothetical protein
MDVDRSGGRSGNAIDEQCDELKCSNSRFLMAGSPARTRLSPAFCLRAIDMPAQFESRITAGLNDYRFVASLHVQHPFVDPNEVTTALKLEPKSVKRRGEPRRKPDGALLTGNYDENHWSADLEIVAGHDVPEFLRNLIDVQMPHAVGLTRRIDDTGGSVSVFIGVFADRLCDFAMPASTLRRLGDAGVSVRLDYYGVGYYQAHDAAEQSGQPKPPMKRDLKS